MHKEINTGAAVAGYFAGYGRFSLERDYLPDPLFTPTQKDNLHIPRTISPSDISVVIPVKDNSRGINLLLEGLLNNIAQEDYPKEVIIVDNCPEKSLLVSSKFTNGGIPLKVIECKKPGAGSARNTGVQESTGKWILFTDSDCIPTKSFISGYRHTNNDSVGHMGNVVSIGSGPLIEYYNSQNIFSPPLTTSKEPLYLITSNSLVLKDALSCIGGFDSSFNSSDCEDIELSLRLRKTGKFRLEAKSAVEHDVGGSLASFVRRFLKYGRGINRISVKLGRTIKLSLPPPNNKTALNCALSLLHYLSLLAGYRAGNN